MGENKKQTQPSEVPVKRSARRSLVARLDISAGTVLTAEMISFKRPGTGISPAEINTVLGKPCKRDIRAEEVLTWDIF